MNNIIQSTNNIIQSTMWCMNPLIKPKTKNGLKIVELRKKAMFLKYIRQKCRTNVRQK